MRVDIYGRGRRCGCSVMFLREARPNPARSLRRTVLTAVQDRQDVKLTRRRIMMLAGALVVAGASRAAVRADESTIADEGIVGRIAQTDLSQAEVAGLLRDLSEEEIARLIENAERIKVRAKAQLTFAQRIERALLNPWVVFGFAAQFMFMMRFVIQWLASERRQRSYVPVPFWYFSLAGGIMLLTYAVQRRDPVFILGQGLGCFIYVRNLILIHKCSGRHAPPGTSD